jgi:plastocyanin
MFTRLARISLYSVMALALPLGARAGEHGSVTGKVEATPAKYLGDTFVYIKEAKGAFKPKTHTIDQKGMTFIPRTIAITVGDTVKFLNHDSVDHNVYSPDHEGYNLGMFPKDKSAERKFDKEGVYSQLCSVHPEMLAYVFVGQNPFAASVAKDGSFTIKDVPPGKYTVEIWNAHLKAAAQEITVAAGKPAEVNFQLKR